MNGHRPAGLLGVGMLVALLAACGGGTHGTASGGPSAGGADAATLPTLWAVRDDPGQIWRLDAGEGGNLFDRIDVAGTPREVAFAGGAAWVATDEGALHKVDTGSGAVVATLETGGRYTALAAAHGALWASGQGRVLRVDPTRAQAVAEVALEEGFRLDALAAGPRGVYVLGGASVVRLDPATGAVTARADLGKGGGHGYGEMAVGPDALWLLDQYSDRLYALDPVTLGTLRELEVPDDWNGELAAGDELLFVSFGDDDQARVLAVDPADLTPRFEIALDKRPKALLSIGGLLVVTPGAFGELRVFDQRTGEARLELAGEYAEAVTAEL